MAGYIGTKTASLSTTAANVTGNITVSGNVDGRDVSVDGTKLDTIPVISTSSTASFIAISDGTTDGYIQLNCSANSHGIKLKSPPHSAGASYTLIFPVNDGNANQVLTTNGSGVLSWSTASSADNTKLPLAGGALTGNVTFGDSNKIVMGAGSDLQIYHDGSNSYISDQGTNDLKILATDFQLKNAADNEFMITGVTDGAVTLYHNNAAKIATSSGGVAITGNIANSSGDMVLDVAGDIILDAAGRDIKFQQDGTLYLSIFNDVSNNAVFNSIISDKDIVFTGNGGGSAVTALTLDMSNAGAATFNGNLVIGTSGNGIDFSAGASGDSTSNLLDEYEEGTFTISMTGATTSRTNATAVYTKVGNLVTFSYYTLSSSVSSTSGYARITGLPFPAKNHNSADVPCTIANNTFFGGSATVGQQAFVAKNSTLIYFMNTGTASQASFVNGSSKYLGITGTYLTA